MDELKKKFEPIEEERDSPVPGSLKIFGR